MSVLIVGLSGVTNGGKSTLAKYLKKVLPSSTKLFKQDDYFLPEQSPLHVPCPGAISHHNWEVISALDMDNMVTDVKSIYSQMASHLEISVSTSPRYLKLDFLETIALPTVNDILSALQAIEKLKGIILIDGFTIYDDPPLKEMTRLKFFLTLSKEECFARRQNRDYDPPDPPGYFDACVWPMYEAHVERVRELGDINFYDGADNIEDIFVSVLRKIVAAAATL